MWNIYIVYPLMCRLETNPISGVCQWASLGSVLMRFKGFESQVTPWTILATKCMLLGASLFHGRWDLTAAGVVQRWIIKEKTKDCGGAEFMFSICIAEIHKLGISKTRWKTPWCKLVSWSTIDKMLKMIKVYVHKSIVQFHSYLHITKRCSRCSGHSRMSKRLKLEMRHAVYGHHLWRFGSKWRVQWKESCSSWGIWWIPSGNLT